MFSLWNQDGKQAPGRAGREWTSGLAVLRSPLEVAMRLTPLDVQHKRFARALRGYRCEEVEAFLSLVSSAFEDLVKENMALREDGQRKDEAIAEHRSRERVLQETLVTAQKASEEIREGARKEAEIALSEAELQAEKIVQGAHQRFVRIVDDIQEVKRQRLQFEAGLRSLVESHLKLLGAFRESGGDDPVEFIPGRKKGTTES
ncbi:MAG TPA: DivIVA domain-containing protein [Anaeromyxobacteraceae bacterium]|nr:DivIVA domain-containing protein [Anaeromyxobacteraceae bacterium]